MQARARAFLLAAKDNAVTEKLAAENNRLTDEIDLLKKQIADMGAKFAEMHGEAGGARKGR
jgi:cell division protein FtsB